MIASLWMMTVLTYFTYGVGTRKRTYVKCTKGTWVLEGMMREWHEEIVFCPVTLRSLKLAVFLRSFSLFSFRVSDI